MKSMLMITLLCVCGLVNAEEQKKIERLEMPNGKVYESVTVTKCTPAWVKILHRSGVSKLMLSECDEQMQELYGYDAEKAKAYLNAQKEISKGVAKKQAKQRLADAKKMEQKAKEKQEKEREYLDYKKGKALEKEEALFFKKLESVALKVQVIADQNAKAGLIGKVTVFKKEMIEKPGSAFEKVTKWKVSKTVDAAVSETTNATVTEAGGKKVMTWSGKAWEIGTTTYKTIEGLDMTCAQFTASQAKAEAYYRAKLRQK